MAFLPPTRKTDAMANHLDAEETAAENKSQGFKLMKYALSLHGSEALDAADQARHLLSDNQGPDKISYDKTLKQLGMTGKWYRGFAREKLAEALKDKVTAIITRKDWTGADASIMRSELQDLRKNLEFNGFNGFTGDRFDHLLQGASGLLGISEEDLEKHYNRLENTIRVACNLAPLALATDPPTSSQNGKHYTRLESLALATGSQTSSQGSPRPQA